MSRCQEPGCKKRAGRNRLICHMHRMRRYAAAQPMRHCYQTLKVNAKRRGKVFKFKLTFEQFKEFAIEVNLLHKRGRKTTSYTVDRIENDKGYVVGNLQRLTLSENSSKGKRQRKVGYDYLTGHGYIQDYHEEVFTDLPF